MNRHTGLLLLLYCFISDYAAGNDPFNNTRRNHYQKTPVTTVESTPIQCGGTQNAIGQELSFHHLKIVGVVQYKNVSQVLFSDDKQLFTATNGDLLAQERFKIVNIGKQELQVTGWQQDCTQGNVISIKF